MILRTYFDNLMTWNKSLSLERHDDIIENGMTDKDLPWTDFAIPCNVQSQCCHLVTRHVEESFCPGWCRKDDVDLPPLHPLCEDPPWWEGPRHRHVPASKHQLCSSGWVKGFSHNKSAYILHAVTSRTCVIIHSFSNKALLAIFIQTGLIKSEMKKSR